MTYSAMSRRRFPGQQYQSPLQMTPAPTPTTPGLGFGINGSQGPGGLSDLLTSLGMGLLTGKNPQEGLGIGLGMAQQMSGDRRQEQRYAQREQREEERFNYDRQRQQTQDQQAAQQAEAWQRAVDSMDLPPDQKAFARAMQGSVGFKELFPQASTDAPTVKDFFDGDKTVQKQWNEKTQEWVQVGEGPRWAPKSEQGMSIDFNGDGTPDFVMGGAGVKLTEAQDKNTGWAARMEGALGDMSAAESGGYDPTAGGATMDYIGQRNIGGLLGNMMTSDKGKQWYRGAKEALAVILRKDSGGAITDGEFKLYGPIYLPMPWDDPATKGAKGQALQTVLGTLKTGSGGGYDINKARAEAEAPAAPTAAPAGAPQPGAIEDGYRFKGGNPADPNSWEPAS